MGVASTLPSLCRVLLLALLIAAHLPIATGHQWLGRSPVRGRPRATAAPAGSAGSDADLRAASARKVARARQRLREKLLQPRPPPGACTDHRPKPTSRKFVSEAVDAYIDGLVADLRASGQSELACVFANTLPNTLDTTVEQAADSLADTDENHASTSFIITGDIHAMWLRDSTNQVLPYLRLARADAGLQAMLGGVVRMQAAQVLTDPYANAFNLVSNGASTAGTRRGATHITSDTTWYRRVKGYTMGLDELRRQQQVAGVFEQKYELDSLCAFLKMSRTYYEHTKDTSVFAGKVPYLAMQSRKGPVQAEGSWLEAVGLVLDVMQEMQVSSMDDRANPRGVAYHFERNSKSPTETLMKGIGAPCNYTGMIRSAFRPSDDATQYQFLVAANAMAVVEVRALGALLDILGPELGLAGAAALATRARTIAHQVLEGIRRYAVVEHGEHGQVFAFEVDGFGNAYFADDANLPSLLSLPWLGFLDREDETYKATRALVLSRNNPWYAVGEAGDGIGGAHTQWDHIWPMSIAMRGLTSTSDKEITECLEMLVKTTGGTGMMHESFNKNDAHDFGRPWFAWANAMFGSLVMQVAEERPHLLGLSTAHRPGSHSDAPSPSEVLRLNAEYPWASHGREEPTTWKHRHSSAFRNLGAVAADTKDSDSKAYLRGLARRHYTP